MICCDGCPKLFHLEYHYPRLLSIPAGQWFCYYCVDSSSQCINTSDDEHESQKSNFSEGSVHDQDSLSIYSFIEFESITFDTNLDGDSDELYSTSGCICIEEDTVIMNPVNNTDETAKGMFLL